MIKMRKMISITLAAMMIISYGSNAVMAEECVEEYDVESLVNEDVNEIDIDNTEEDTNGIVDGLVEYTSAAETKAEVLRRIEEVHKVLPGENSANHAYFNTLNNSPCAHSNGLQKCDYCEYNAVMRNRLGINKVFATGDDSWTCLGFVKFMHEYIFRRCFANNMKSIWAGGFDKSEINKYATAGDFVYFNSLMMRY